MPDLSDEEAAERFQQIVTNDKLQNDQIYQELAQEAFNAIARCLQRIDDLGFNDLDGFDIAIECPKGHIHPIVKVLRVTKDGKFHDED